MKQNSDEDRRSWQQDCTAIEDGFPFEHISEIAEAESWRKEIHRPIYHVHKWWAQRLGSVFRAALIGAASSSGANIMDLFYRPVRFPGLVVFDPFMGSGTTIGEALKLGCTAIGRDINPVAHRMVRSALSPLDEGKLKRLFYELESSVGEKIKQLYKSKDSQGNECDVLYYFWVKFLPCPSCGSNVDLFASYIFAKHAYPKRHTKVRVVCPCCGSIDDADYLDETHCCRGCGLKFDLRSGPAKRTTAVCAACDHEFQIAAAARANDTPPAHRLYAKLVLTADGKKEYLGITADDQESFERAKRILSEERSLVPHVRIAPGYNTKQILNYSYSHWDQLFNERQLLSLAWLAEGIRQLPESPERGALQVLFSGVLEFNNMFVSYKGEGTGAVRHMFFHHILKPERTPLEANVWGTQKSSGAFSTLFRSRLLRSLGYAANPHEIFLDTEAGGRTPTKIYGISDPIRANLVDEFSAENTEGAVYISCGDSSETGIPDQSVDVVLTDPPFFDNVHYSELSDFFFVWQELYFNGYASGAAGQTTRSPLEVQDTDADRFSRKLCNVFCECRRVLKPGGLLIFSYHHSRSDGWQSVAAAVRGAGFSFVQCQPVKSEMAGATPKNQAKEPINLDVFLICRKNEEDQRPLMRPLAAFAMAKKRSEEKVRRFNELGRRLSRNDIQVILKAELLVTLSAGRNSDELLLEFESKTKLINGALEEFFLAQAPFLKVPQPPSQVALPL